jgi:hypothetical protein
VALKSLDELTHDILAYRCTRNAPLGRQFSRKEVCAPLAVAGRQSATADVPTAAC